MVQQKIIKFIITLAFLAIGFIFAGGRDNKEAVNEKQISIPGIDTTKLEKYERKVIIKAKVGKGPGEIGVIGEGPIPEKEALWECSMEGPKGIAVDSDGDIYILDNLNKRILKFSSKGKYHKAISTHEVENYLEGLGNHLLIDDAGNFYIMHRLLKLGDRMKCKYKYNESGKILAREFDIPDSLLNMGTKRVTGDISMYMLIPAIQDTVVHYYILDSVRNTKYTINVYLPKRNGWEYDLNSYSFLGFDKDDNAYVAVTALEEIHVWSTTNRLRAEECIVFKYNKEGKLVAIIKETTPGIGFEFWTLGGDGALYLLKYAFKDVVTDEMPDWVKNNPTMTKEEKTKWRRAYTAPEGDVYVVKFAKMEGK